METNDIKTFLADREEQDLLRTLKPVSARRRGRIVQAGKEYIDFSSNDYLGLSEHPLLVRAGQQALEVFGTASSASRLMSGDLELHHQLEETVAQWKGAQAALVFNSGYQANCGIISALYGKADCVIADKLVHASILDGIALSGARLFRFRHNDPDHARYLLKKERRAFKKALIVTESVFSMDGDRAPLRALTVLKREYHGEFMVDEAHASGVFGERASGLVEEEGVGEDVDLVMGTFSKALGGFGAYLATDRLTRDYLINTCRSFIFSTALPPAVIAINLAGISVAMSEPERRGRLLDQARLLRRLLGQKGFTVKGDAQIVPVVFGSAKKTLALSSLLREKGYWALAVRPPTVPENESRLRFSVSYYHDARVIREVADVLKEIAVSVI
jgi:8-amino-7-oxononanoate synthase